MFCKNVQDKQHWRRYIYLWIYYAVFEECVTKDIDRARDVYNMCLQLIPHKLFTFAEIWLLYAKFEIRRKNLTAARKTLVCCGIDKSLELRLL
jgi:crooked neck